MELSNFTTIDSYFVGWSTINYKHYFRLRLINRWMRKEIEPHIYNDCRYCLNTQF